MDKIELPTDEIVPLDTVASGVVGLRILFVNVFAVGDGAGWTLIDAGLNGSAGRIRRWAREHFGEAPPRAIVLTHAHFDHVGAIDELLKSWDVPVYAHKDELPYVTGKRSYPEPDPSVGGGLMARMSALYPRGPIDLSGRVRQLPDDGTVPGMAGWRWVHTPGHTAGHVSLFRDRDRALIVGDAFCTTKPESFLAVATQRTELHGPPAYFTTDWGAARDSVIRLAVLEPAFVAAGHGQPMAGHETAAALYDLANRFDDVARPEHGRYVGQTEPYRKANSLMTNTELARTETLTKPISPAQHAVLDYGVAATFLAYGFSVRSRHRSAAALAFLNGAMVLGMSMLTDYPGGIFRTLSFRAHRTGDIVQGALAGLGPIMFGFGSDPEAKYFYGQAASEAAVIAATDWNAA